MMEDCVSVGSCFGNDTTAVLLLLQMDTCDETRRPNDVAVRMR